MIGSTLTVMGLLTAVLLVSVALPVFYWVLRYIGRASQTAPCGLETFAVLVLSTVFFEIALIVLQVPLTAALGRWLTENVASASPAVVGLPALVAGVVQEPVKLAAALLGLRLTRRPKPPGSAPGLVDLALQGVLAGLAAGLFEAAMVLSPALAAVPATGLGAAVPVIVERWFAIVFHGSVTGLAVVLWLRGRGWPGLVFAILVHSLLNYIAGVLSLTLGLSGTWAIEGLAAAAAVSLLLLLRRSLLAPDHPAGFSEGVDAP